MNEIIELIRKKSQLMYDINSIKGYIEQMEYDKNLKNAWDHFTNELDEVTKELEKLKKPHIEELEKKKIELLTLIKNHEDELEKLKQQLNDLDKIITEINK